MLFIVGEFAFSTTLHIIVYVMLITLMSELILWLQMRLPVLKNIL